MRPCPSRRWPTSRELTPNGSSTWRPAGLVGGITYGWGPYVGPTEDQIELSTFGWRLLIISGYLLVVGAFAFALGVWTDAPLAAVGGAVMLTILSAILDTIPALGGLREDCPGTTRSPGPTRCRPWSTSPTW